MPACKVIVGLACFVMALWTGGLALGTTRMWFSLDSSVVFAIVLALVFFALGLVAAGVYTIARRHTPMAKKTRAFVGVGVILSSSLSTVFYHYLHRHNRTGVKLLEEDIRKVDALIEQIQSAPDQNTKTPKE